MVRGRQGQLGADDELTIGRRILALEAEVAQLVRAIPAGAAVLDRPVRRGRTRAVSVDRLAAAVEAAVKADPKRGAAARRRWDEAQALRWKLALSAQRLARREARRLAANPVLSEEDLVQEGLIGLLGAAKRFEPDRGLRFSTYARWWARAQMTRAIDLCRLVRMSARAAEQLRNLRMAIRQREALGGTWTVRDVARDLGLDPTVAENLLMAGEGRGSEDPVGDTVLHLVDERIADPEEQAATNERVERLHKALRTSLPERHRRVLQHRYGIGREQRSLAEIARGMSLSGERVRQLERESLAVLRESGGLA